MNSLISRIKLKAKMFDLPEKRNQAYWQGVDDVGNIIDSLPMVEAYTKDEVANILENLKQDISKMAHYESPDGQALVMLADIGILFEERINELRGKENGT